MKNSQQPIGIFDSGVGGLTVYKELKQQLPQENFIYLGDTARVPYGTKSKDIVIRYALQNCLFLMEHKVKLIVVACNTASAVALEFLQDRLKTPVIGVIEPGAHAALAATKNKHVGVIGTEGTITSHVYEQALKKNDPQVTCYSQATGLFVPMIEEGVFDDSILTPVFKRYLDFFADKDIDTLILGCTHYPILKNQISNFLQNKVTLVDSAHTTAVEVKALLKKADNLNPEKTQPKTRICFSDAPDRVQNIARFILEDNTVGIERTELL